VPEDTVRVRAAALGLAAQILVVEELEDDPQPLEPAALTAGIPEQLCGRRLPRRRAQGEREETDRGSATQG